MADKIDETDELPEPEIIETEIPPLIIEMDEADGIVINTEFSSDRRLRKAVYERLLGAQKHLPQGYQFMIFEAYRSRARQFELWNELWTKMVQEHPDKTEEELSMLCSNFVSNPYGVGSGHQFGAAIDVSILDERGYELDMGTKMQEFCDKTETAFEGMTPEQKQNRELLKSSLEKEGLVNYPAEWWHYSYGDRKWAQLTGKSQTIYGILPF